MTAFGTNLTHETDREPGERLKEATRRNWISRAWHYLVDRPLV